MSSRPLNQHPRVNSVGVKTIIFIPTSVPAAPSLFINGCFSMVFKLEKLALSSDSKPFLYCTHSSFESERSSLTVALLRRNEARGG